MTNVDGDSNGMPDGIINLYDAYNTISKESPISLETVSWKDPNLDLLLYD